MSEEPEKHSTQRRPSNRTGKKKPDSDAVLQTTWIVQITVLLVAVLGCVSTVIVALLNSPVANNIFPARPTETLVRFLPSDTPFPTLVSASETPTAIEQPTIIPTDTSLAVNTPTPDATTDISVQSGTTLSPESKMIVVLSSSLDEGRSPLPVNFVAKNSFVQFADGTTAPCGQTNFCTFTWSVRLGSREVVAPTKGQSSFSYTFTGKGTYSVTVYICRSGVCAYDAAVVVVK